MKNCIICNKKHSNKMFCSLQCYWKYAKGKTFREYTKGYHLPEETKEKIRQKATGRGHSQKTKDKLSMLYKGKTYKEIHASKSNLIKTKISDGLKKAYKEKRRSPIVSNATKKKISDTLKKKYASGEIQNHGGIPHIKSGYRPDLNMYVRSSWEANIARVFKYCKVKFDYEPKRFVMKNDNTILGSYLPDFYLPQSNVWVEVKGYLSLEDENRINLFKEYYPQEILVVVKEDLYYLLMHLFQGEISNLELQNPQRPYADLLNQKQMIWSDLHGNMQSSKIVELLLNHII
jgi:hypothetical protein